MKPLYQKALFFTLIAAFVFAILAPSIPAYAYYNKTCDGGKGTPEDPEICHAEWTDNNGIPKTSDCIKAGIAWGCKEDGEQYCKDEVKINSVAFNPELFGADYAERSFNTADKWCKTPSNTGNSNGGSSGGNSSNNNNNGDSGSGNSSSSNASGSTPYNYTFSGNCRNFIGLVSWDCNVDISNEDTLKTGIWTIIANVAVDITVLAAYLVLGYTIYGGYLYTLSGGDPGKVANGKKALAQAFIGLAIVMSANVILNSIRIALGVNFTANCASQDCGIDPGSMITSTIQWVIGIAGVVSAIFVVYGGISYAMSAGDPNKVKKAKDMILYALIGLAIVALAEIITAFVSNMIREANQQTSSIIQLTKEEHETKKII